MHVKFFDKPVLTGYVMLVCYSVPPNYLKSSYWPFVKFGERCGCQNWSFCRYPNEISIPSLVRIWKLWRPTKDLEERNASETFKFCKKKNSWANCVAFSALTCWLGIGNSIRPVKNWVMRCWHGYLSGASKWFAYGPADTTAILSSPASLTSGMVSHFWCWLTHFVLEKSHWTCGVCLEQIVPKPVSGSVWFL